MSIELRNVSKKFGGVTAVKNVNFSVKEGELVALLGPSGGGKTTVLRMISGLEMPTEVRNRRFEISTYSERHSIFERRRAKRRF